MKRLFALSLSALLFKSGVTTAVSRAAYTMANSDVEAVGLGVAKAQEIYPQSDGWSSQSASAVEIPTLIDLEG